MKKALSLLLPLVLCLSLCACGGGNDTTKEPDTSTETTAPTQQESENNTTESTHDEEPTQETGRIETDHPLLSYLFGTWKLQNEEDIEKNPYTEITFNEDGTCIIEGAEYRWVIAEEKETMLVFNILSGNEKFAGASLSCNKDGLFTGFMAMGKEDYNFCPGVWENTSNSTASE